jgi:hypothetical protein
MLSLQRQIGALTKLPAKIEALETAANEARQRQFSAAALVAIGIAIGILLALVFYRAGHYF